MNRTLAVPGAALHYELTGDGPPLLLISGGSGDSAFYAPLAARLAGHFTVVTYDSRGANRSTLDGPVADQSVRVHADDARRLLDEVFGGEPVSVFGSSSGAIVSLDLLARHPGRLRRVVAHEPPVLSVLPDAAGQHALFARVRDTFRDAGIVAAMDVLNAGLTGTPERPSGGPEPTGPMRADMSQFLGHILVPFSSYVPDLPALRAAAPKLVPAAGEESRGQVLHRAMTRLAEETGAVPVEFPGGHVGAAQEPDAFAAVLVKTLSTTSESRQHQGREGRTLEE